MAEAGEGPEVALQATYGYYWAADLLKENGAHVHLVHPLGLHYAASLSSTSDDIASAVRGAGAARLRLAP